MLGQNPQRKAIFNDGTSLAVKNIFRTIQGEGPLVGIPAIFIRLGGCNLTCDFCDTDFEGFNILHIDDITHEVQKLTAKVKLIVITGGEPFRQPIELLSIRLLNLGYLVQIETNGTLYRPIPDEVQIVCSPKASNKGYSLLREDLLPKITALKFLVSENLLPYSDIPELGQTSHNIPVFIQPMDQYDPVLNKANQQLATKLAIKYGYRLSLQIHKILDIE